MRFLDKVVLVTGAGRGIGRASALRFAEEGARVAVVDIDEDNANAVVDEIVAAGGEALAIVADVTQEADAERMVAETVAHLGQLDIVFNNAGISRGARVAEMPAETWDRVIAVNLRSVFLGCKYSIPALIEAGGGAIVNMGSSMAGWDAFADGAAYMASKEGVTGLTRSLALQLGGHGIRVNAVCPGVIQTRLNYTRDMTDAEWETIYEEFAKRIPLRRVGQPEDVAATVAFLASDDARHITGSMLLIDGGQTLQSWSNAPDADAYPLKSTP